MSADAGAHSAKRAAAGAKGINTRPALQEGEQHIVKLSGHVRHGMLSTFHLTGTHL
jgi:hypothetical protein